MEIGPGKEISQAEVTFLTPVRIKVKGKISFPLEFPVFLRNILRRISIISYFFEERELVLDFKGMLREAEGVKLKVWEGKPKRIRRHSTRKGGKMEFLGFLGRLVYSGNLGPFASWLRVGELFHVGKTPPLGLENID